MAGAGMGQPPGLWRRRCMGQPLVSISTGGRPSSGSLGPPPDCGNVLETRTGSSSGKNPDLRTLENPDAHLPCRSLSTIRISQKSEVSIAGDAHNPRNLLGSRGFQRLYESEKSPPDFTQLFRTGSLPRRK